MLDSLRLFHTDVGQFCSHSFGHIVPRSTKSYSRLYPSDTDDSNSDSRLSEPEQDFFAVDTDSSDSDDDDPSAPHGSQRPMNQTGPPVRRGQRPRRPPTYLQDYVT